MRKDEVRNGLLLGDAMCRVWPAKKTAEEPDNTCSECGRSISEDYEIEVGMCESCYSAASQESYDETRHPDERR